MKPKLDHTTTPEEKLERFNTALSLAASECWQFSHRHPVLPGLPVRLSSVSGPGSIQNPGIAQ